MNTLKPLFLVCMLLTALAWRVIGQSPTVTPELSPSPTVSVAPTTSVSPSPTAESKLERAIRNKARHHFGVTINDHNDDLDRLGKHADEIPALVVPIVAVVFLSIFGAPVLIVAVILYFGFSKTRMKHRTIRMLVEKGQPIPPELLAPPTPTVRQRSDMRRGVVLLMVGLGVMVFLGAVNDWEGGAWALGIIPFLIGAGYLLVWKFDSRKDNPPPLP
ncbi:MAG: DUF6249 domain-containing protein [Chthoniobacterales bacterium]